VEELKPKRSLGRGQIRGWAAEGKLRGHQTVVESQYPTKTKGGLFGKVFDDVDESIFGGNAQGHRKKRERGAREDKIGHLQGNDT